MTDIIVIDAGPAGVLAALRASELGARTTLAASGEFGGDDYTADCVKGLLRWNKVITTAGINYELKLPHVAFHRQIGEFKDVHATPTGDLIDESGWSKRKAEWLPSADDVAFIGSLMHPQSEPGQFASWISPPKVGIDNKPGDFEYVRLAA